MRLIAITVAALLTAAAVADPPSPADVEHPFMLWTRAELASIRKRIKNDATYRKAFEQFMDNDGRSMRQVQNLVRAAVLQDEAAIEGEIKELMSVVNSPAPRGGAQWITVLQYDLFHDRLSDAQQKKIEDVFRFYIRNTFENNAVFDPELYNDERNYSRYDAKKYTRTNWLPNIIAPRKFSANLMAAALRDETLIRDTWAAYGSWQWYFDEYLSDVGFYHEEFSKMGSTSGAMLIYCLAVERLGLNELGFGYEGKGGATMRGHIKSLIHVTYPYVDLHSSRPHYPRVTMGDLRRGGSGQSWNLSTPAFQHSTVMGYLPGGVGEGTQRWAAHGAWGGTKRGNLPQWDGYHSFTPKMLHPVWFELGHRRWPEDGYGFFLYAMRAPDQDVYLPTPMFGIDPVTTKQAKPPKAPSAAWQVRGMVMLRSNESEAHWTSPDPVSSFRTASPYAHGVNDSFAVMGLYAFHRPIYLNRQIWPGYAQGWSRSIESHAAVKVDDQEPRLTYNAEVKHSFGEAAKFFTMASDEIYDGVDYRRSFVQTKQYLFEITELSSKTPRDYYWFVHGVGVPADPTGRRKPQHDWPAHLEKLDVIDSEAVGRLWATEIHQQVDPAYEGDVMLPKAWYDRGIGVRIGVWGGLEDLTAYVARTPNRIVRWRDKDTNERKEARPLTEVRGTTVMLHGRGKQKRFAVMHEPFENADAKIERFTLIDKTHSCYALAGEDGVVNDRILFNSDMVKASSAQYNDEYYTYIDYGFVRIGKETIVIEGRVTSARIPVAGSPKLVVNGKEVEATVTDGVLVFDWNR